MFTDTSVYPYGGAGLASGTAPGVNRWSSPHQHIHRHCRKRFCWWQNMSHGVQRNHDYNVGLWPQMTAEENCVDYNSINGWSTYIIDLDDVRGYRSHRHLGIRGAYLPLYHVYTKWKIRPYNHAKTKVTCTRETLDMIRHSSGWYISYYHDYWHFHTSCLSVFMSKYFIYHEWIFISQYLLLRLFALVKCLIFYMSSPAHPRFRGRRRTEGKYDIKWREM